LAVFLGVLWFLMILFKVIKGFWRHCCRSRFQSKKRAYEMYGKVDSSKKKVTWAVVTGASDGIGLAICYKLAR